jgi:hypothetical protein
MNRRNVIAKFSKWVLVFVILGSCNKGRDSSDIKKSIFEGNSHQNTPRDSVVNGLVLDTIILLEPYKVYLYEDQNEWSWYYGIYDTAYPPDQLHLAKPTCIADFCGKITT